jgi:ribosomal protein L39E
MNIFYLDHDPRVCAEMHNDKHTVKMIIEYAQLLSTAHRILDGDEYTDLTSNGRKIKRWRMRETYMENGLMKASHINHPSNVWVRASRENYIWLYQLWLCLMKEYTYRYGKNHACESRIPYLSIVPTNILDLPFTQPTPAMPDEYKVSGDSIKSYHQYYTGSKTHLAKWKNRPVPNWYSANSFAI